MILPGLLSKLPILPFQQWRIRRDAKCVLSSACFKEMKTNSAKYSPEFSFALACAHDGCPRSGVLQYTAELLKKKRKHISHIWGPQSKFFVRFCWCLVQFRLSFFTTSILYPLSLSLPRITKTNSKTPKVYQNYHRTSSAWSESGHVCSSWYRFDFHSIKSKITIYPAFLPGCCLASSGRSECGHLVQQFLDHSSPFRQRAAPFKGSVRQMVSPATATTKARKGPPGW